jgi:hypothetical protein
MFYIEFSKEKRGEGREGKERKGKERKGKERKGKRNIPIEVSDILVDNGIEKNALNVEKHFPAHQGETKSTTRSEHPEHDIHYQVHLYIVK